MLNIISKNLFLLNSKEKIKTKIIILINIFNMLIEISAAALIYPLIKLIINPKTEIFTNYFDFFKKFIFFDGAYNQHLTIILFIVILSIFKAIVFFLNVLFQARTIASINLRISTELYEKYINLDWVLLTKKDIPSILRNINLETANFSTKNINSIIALITDSFFIIGLIILLVVIDPKASISSIIFLTFFSLLIFLKTKSYNLRFGKIRAKQTQILNKHLIQTFRAIRNIKIANIQKNFIYFFEKNCYSEIRVRTNQSIIQQLPRGILELIGVITVVFLILILNIIGTDFENSVSFIGIFFLCMIRLLPAINRILQSIQALRYGKSTINILISELNSKDNLQQINSNKISKSFNENFKTLEFKDVNFSYDKNKKVLNNLSFIIKHRQIIGISGESGSGKSTILDLISGLIKEDSGQILINGKEHIVSSNDWQKKIGFVFQDTYLLNDTLKKNIAIGIKDEDIDDKKINFSIKYSQLDKFVSTSKNNIEQNFGDIEQKLSGGQKQRIGIARALYNNPEILILDEATSALDYVTEKKILSILTELKKKCTIIIVSHKENTLKICDKIIEL